MEIALKGLRNNLLHRTGISLCFLASFLFVFVHSLQLKSAGMQRFLFASCKSKFAVFNHRYSVERKVSQGSFKITRNKVKKTINGCLSGNRTISYLLCANLLIINSPKSVPDLMLDPDPFVEK